VKDIYRHRNQGCEDTATLVAYGLHNLRCDYPLAA
jgi:hypothetical protein